MTALDPDPTTPDGTYPSQADFETLNRANRPAPFDVACPRGLRHRRLIATVPIDVDRSRDHPLMKAPTDRRSVTRGSTRMPGITTEQNRAAGARPCRRGSGGGRCG